MTRTRFAMLIMVIALAGPWPATASQMAEKSPTELAREGVETLLRALDAFIESIPQYGVPRIDENGDIIVPRKKPREVEQTPPGLERIRI